jgi:transposase
MAAQKKLPVASERDEEARGLWRWLASRFDARRLVFVDESGFHTSMTRLRARAPRGKRAYGKVPRNRGKNTTLIASITLQGGMGESMSVEGATDALAFETYVEHFLAPSLCEGQVVVLDGLGVHRTERIRELIEARGADLVLLPSYSPDLNSIEEAFSKIKHLVRKEASRAQGGRPRARGASGGDRRSVGGRHARRRRRLVRTRRLLASGSTLMSTAVTMGSPNSVPLRLGSVIPRSLVFGTKSGSRLRLILQRLGSRSSVCLSSQRFWPPMSCHFGYRYVNIVTLTLASKCKHISTRQRIGVWP